MFISTARQMKPISIFKSWLKVQLFKSDSDNTGYTQIVFIVFNSWRLCPYAYLTLSINEALFYTIALFDFINFGSILLVFNLVLSG